MDRSAERLGILGGTFDPVHFGHLLIAQEAWYRLKLARVIFIPAAHNPLKPDDGHGCASADQRLAMLRSAVDPDTRFCVDALELRRGGLSYTIDTLKRLRQLHPASELDLIMGADAALTLGDWKDIDQYGELCRILVCNRPGSNDLSQGLPAHLSDLNLRYEFMPLPPVDISSSELRRRIRQGKPVRYYVPDAVADYIRRHGLYAE